MEERKTVGAIALDLMQKDSPTRSPIELEQEMHKDYEKNIYECVDRGKKENNGDFFVVVVTKKERIMENVLRNYFAFRSTCPTPEWDQTLYHYHSDGEHVEFLWVVPSKDTCRLFMDNVLRIDNKERDLLKFILDFEDGTLLRQAKKLNGEMEQSIILEK